MYGIKLGVIIVLENGYLIPSFFLDRLAFWEILQEKCFEVLESQLDQRS